VIAPAWNGVSVPAFGPVNLSEEIAMAKALGYAANHSFSRLKPHEFERDEPGAIRRMRTRLR
jgi:hypothetical protein